MALVAPVLQALDPAKAEAARRRLPLWKGYEFVHGPECDVFVDWGTKRRRIDVTVKKDGNVVESFRNANPRNLRKLDSKYFKVRYIRAPRGTG